MHKRLTITVFDNQIATKKERRPCNMFLIVTQSSLIYFSILFKPQHFFQYSQAFLQACSQYFLCLFEIIDFMQSVMNLKKLFLAIFLYKHGLSFTGICAIIGWLIEALRTFCQFTARIASINGPLPTAFNIWTDTHFINCPIGTTAKY